MNASTQSGQLRDAARETLGDLLYAGDPVGQAPDEREWAQLVQAMASGDARALQALHERSHRVVFTILMRMLDDRGTAEELTLEVFQTAWQSAAQYDPWSGSTLGWLMNLARASGLRQLQRQGVNNGSSHRLLAALEQLAPQERQLIELVYFSTTGLADAVSVPNEPLDEVRMRVHSALEKLCEAFASNTGTP